ncbi:MULTISPECIES: 3-hydroxyisobutyrate dehydrogenase [Pseudonocardia]|uniref:3-hydroxyisobutyrate dehydrogenase n=2 Tax=Pseudonocardia TaxID=1847 RepID=A0A1Y2N9A8_PSEAH|nr:MULTISPECIES: 3-hydroxyisobutyrate dehydrogenase [Pseudonocardia]OSY44065.1 3-hydroxyisobutyrate dehydrogenase [Pseudonocardia autotrophica]TDN74205.1 3-hydroxyisobutyrate dehydrogenase [Pseudonocardia autotrophica]BBG04965.1 3-hydroxyisobutyrate dehydrogenase [Pseudonocardia autotrophica]GEC23621.1 3-hydroxyisobutyrate dehydrogenase [Pseudonocardia saturnea]
MSRIAVVGLGNMGGPMAANLVAAGHTVTGYDPVPAARETAARAGVDVAGSSPEAVTGAEVVITMLPSGKHVTDVYAELLPAAPAGALFVDCSTIDVGSSRAAHAAAAAAGHRSVDAPVSGGVVGAEAGTLTFMAGGAPEAITDAEPVLAVLGKRTVRCGDPGAGQVAKMCNNMVLGASMIAVSEAFVLAEKLGLEPQALFDVVSTSSGQCWAVSTNCPVPGPVPGSPANRDFTGGFAAQLMLKDLRLAQDAAAEAGIELAMGRRATERYTEFTERDDRVQDFSAIVTDIRKGG